MAALTPVPKIQFFTANGEPLVGGKLYSYAAGTTTPLVTYTDQAGTSANTNPVILDSRGEASVWLGTGPYKLRLTSATDVDIWTVDDIYSEGSQSMQELLSSSGSSLVGFIADGTGAQYRTVQAKLRDTVSVKDFGAVGDGTTDDTAAIQAAITTGSSIVFPAGTYRCANLTQSTNFQRFTALGQVTLTKNANGPIITCSGNYVEFNGIQFNGDTTSTPTFTGDNVVMTGSNPRLINCGSQWASGRALKATGRHVQVIGTCGIYQTADATATGYDIEIGASGTATLYHELYGVYSSQSTGGILLTDTGSHHIVGGQFGKLTIASGTAPAGSNGGMTVGARILGDVTVNLSNSVFTGNQFSTQTITFGAGTSQHSIDASNNTVTATIVNNGNANSTIVRATSAGGTYDFAFGPSSWTGSFKVNNSNDFTFASNAILTNNKGLRFLDSTGTEYNGVTLSSSDDWTIGANNGANFTNIASGTVGIFNVVAGTSITQTGSSYFRPVSDNTISLGGSSNRWSVVYAGTGTINTSDEREKQDIAALDAAEKRVAVALKGLVKKFRFKDAVQAKGDGARIHVGVIAQEVIAAFQAEGLDATHYGLLCYDQWDAEEDKPSGNRYGVRYEELLAFIIAAL